MIRAFLLLLLLPTVCFGDEVSDLIDGALARSKAIKSGRMVWDKDWHFPDQGQGAGGKVPGLLHYFSWSGTSWAEGGGGTSGRKNEFGYPVRTTHDGYSIEGFGHYQMTKAVPFNRTLQQAPIWAGTLRQPEEEFAFKKYKDRFKAIPDKDIEGVVSKGIEIRRESLDPKSEQYPFGSPVMRFYIAPQMGYVITSVEGLVNDAAWRKDWNTDWHEVAPGIFMPYKIHCWSLPKVPGQLGPNDKVDQKRDFVIIDATLINQPIPDGDFRAKVEAGKIIEDNRAGKIPVRVKVGESCSSEKWDKLFDEERAKKAQRRSKSKDAIP